MRELLHEFASGLRGVGIEALVVVLAIVLAVLTAAVALALV